MCKKCEEKQNKKCKSEEVYPLTNQPMIRPKVHFLRAMISVTIAAIAIGALVWFILWVLSKCDWYSAVTMSYNSQFALLYSLIALVVIVFSLKHIVVFIIRIYQRYMPYDIRCNCLFVPNCSEYMILAIKKYGVYKGVRKGFNRLGRCHEPNGGVDYP